jgi:hypothetical protein
MPYAVAFFVGLAAVFAFGAELAALAALGILVGSFVAYLERD